MHTLFVVFVAAAAFATALAAAPIPDDVTFKQTAGKNTKPYDLTVHTVHTGAFCWRLLLACNASTISSLQPTTSRPGPVGQAVTTVERMHAI
jgi:hypothetical protein